MTLFIARENGDIKTAVKRILAFYKSKIKIANGVFLKPNIVFPVSDNTGQITRRVVVRAIVESLKEFYPGVDIVIGEGTAAGTDPGRNFSISGYSQLANDLKVKLLNLDETTEFVKEKWHYGNLYLPKIVYDRFYINLPILKKSTAAGISGALKNQKGILQAKTKKSFHMLGLHEPIAHLNKTIQPDLIIMDGYNVFKPNILIAGENTYDVDDLALKIMGGSMPEHVHISSLIGIGSKDSQIEGDAVDRIHSKWRYTSKPYKKLLNLRLWNNPRACSMCRFLLQDIKRFSGDNWQYATVMSLKIAKYALQGVEIVYGSKAQFENKHGNVICIGDCTRKIAEKGNHKFIQGCPPTKEQMLKEF